MNGDKAPEVADGSCGYGRSCGGSRCGDGGAGHALMDVAEDEESGDGEDEEKDEDADPTEAELVGTGVGGLNAGHFFGVGEPFIFAFSIRDYGREGGVIAGEPGTFFEVEEAEIAAKDAAVEDTAREEIEALFFKGAKMADADLGGLGNLLQRDTGFFSFDFQIGAEIAHKCDLQIEECPRKQCNAEERESG
jgi:hypothetical protein